MRRSVASAATLAALLVAAPVAVAAPKDGSPRDPRAQAFVKEVSLPRVEAHQRKLQQIADANGGTRVVTGKGYTDSLAYVVRTLRKAGYQPQVTPFNFPFWSETAPPTLAQVSPAAKTYRPGTSADDGSATVDFITMAYSPTAALKALPVVPVGPIAIPPSGAGASTSGCAATDYPAAVKGAIALIQRGTCAFVDKVLLAQAAGAAGVIIFNDGVGADRQNPVFVEDQADITVPAVVASAAVGQELYAAAQAGQNPTVDLATNGVVQDRFFDQVIADTPKGDPHKVVVVGAHLDSVEEGPGINDDGSGTAALLTMAQRVIRPGHPLKQKLRFAWWGAEEEGLIGSSYYAANLSGAQVKQTVAMLDFDMLSSPNYVPFVYDGDGSAQTDGVDNPAGPAGSGTVEEVFREWFASKRQPVFPTAFDGRSDYMGFTDRGIPAGGVFAGAEGIKTAAQERLYGGVAGSWFDPCYHQACDSATTVLGGAPALDAEGLVPDGTAADKAAAAEKLRGGARRSFADLGSAAAYATWYFGTVADPLGTGATTAKVAKAKKRVKGRHAKPRYRGLDR